MSLLQAAGPMLLVWVLLRIVAPLFLAYVVYADGKRQGEDAAELWAVVVGGFGYLTWSVGGLIALGVYFFQSDRRSAAPQATNVVDDEGA